MKASERFSEELEDFAKSDEKTIVVVTALDELEQIYIKEFDKIIEKDKKANKDLNKLAILELKRASYYFHYARTQEKL